jgi:hypothetical protein
MRQVNESVDQGNFQYLFGGTGIGGIVFSEVQSWMIPRRTPIATA